MECKEIRWLRRALRLNQTEFAQLLGVHPVTVSRWETPGSGCSPNAYQSALMQDFEKAARSQDADFSDSAGYFTKSRPRISISRGRP